MHKNTDQKHGKMFPCLTGKKAPAGGKPAGAFFFCPETCGTVHGAFAVTKAGDLCGTGIGGSLLRWKPGTFLAPEFSDEKHYAASILYFF